MEKYKKECIIVAIVGIFCIIILVCLSTKPSNNISYSICFNSSNPSSYQSYINNMQIILNQYKKSKKVIHCSSDHVCNPKIGKPFACQNNWDFKNGRPCIFFTFSNNSHYNFYNDNHNDSGKWYIDKPGEWDKNNLYQFWISCFKYSTTFDRDIQYYFPKSNIDYLPPIVGVRVFFLDEYEVIVPGEYKVECNLLRRDAKYETKEILEKIVLHIKQGKPCKEK